MKSIKIRLPELLATISFLAIAIFIQTPTVQAATDDKLKTEDILAKHLASIGTAEARKAVSSIMGSGTAKAVARGRTAGETAGLVVIASEGDKNLVGMRFQNNDYPYEKMGYDGNAFTVGFLRPGLRSELGEFLLENEDSFKVGILGGALSTAWELLDYDQKVGKFKCGGTSKIDGVEHYKCKYEPKRSPLKITLYFNPETFRHVRTEYKRVISGGQGQGINNSARQTETRFELIEDFSDFKEVNSLTLPHTYKITYDKQGTDPRSGRDLSTNIEWTMQLSDFIFNQKIDDKEFKVDNF